MFTHIRLTSPKSLKWRSTERRAESQQPRTKTKTCTSLAADRNSEWRADSATSSACSSTRYSQSSCIAMCRWEIWKQWQRRASAVMTARLAWSAIFLGFYNDSRSWSMAQFECNGKRCLWSRRWRAAAMVASSASHKTCKTAEIHCNLTTELIGDHREITRSDLPHDIERVNRNRSGEKRL